MGIGRPLKYNMIGQRFGDLEVLRRSDKKAEYPYWVCRCHACGREDYEAAGHNLRRGNTRSCGCRTSELLSASLKGKNLTHGLTQGGRIPPEYSVWRDMKRRCLDPANEGYKNYGGRGISVCRRWMDFGRFYEDMGLRPSPKHTLEREDTNGNYTPENCRWATWIEQANNKRNNYLITYKKRTQTLAQWARETGLEACTILQRLEVRFWSEEKALTTPVKKTAPLIFNGRMQTLKEWSRETGIPYGTLYERAGKGWSAKEVLRQ